ITRGLQETGLVRVFAGPRGDPASQTPRWASKLEIGTILGGRYYLRGDSIVMQLWVTAPEDGEVVASIGPVTTSLADPTLGIDVLRRRAMAVLATHVDPALSQWARSASQPPSFEAYREFSKGKSAFNRDDFQGAVEHYLRASALDSEYVYPLLMAAVLKKDVLGASASADSLVRSVRRHARRLAPFDDALASMLEAQLAGDYDGWYDAAQRIRLYVAARLQGCTCAPCAWAARCRSRARSGSARLTSGLAGFVEVWRPGSLEDAGAAGGRPRSRSVDACRELKR